MQDFNYEDKRPTSFFYESIRVLSVEAKETAQTLRTEMKELKSEMIKWMFIFWVGQIAATLGILLLFLKK